MGTVPTPCWRTVRRWYIACERYILAMPRIDPGHFTVETFENILRRTMLAPCWKETDETKAHEKAVEFVWVDVACIDQEDLAMRMSEVGRQAGRAKVVAMWLSSLWDLG